LFGRDGYREALLRYIPEEFIPTCAGGKSTAWLEAGGQIGRPVEQANKEGAIPVAGDLPLPDLEGPDESPVKPEKLGF